MFNMDEASSSTPILKTYFVNKPHILLVDYNAFELHQAARVLEANSCRVTKINCEFEAMGILLNEEGFPNKIPEIDLVCMEFGPDRYSYDNATWLLRTIKDSAALKDMPVVVLSDSPYARDTSKELGAISYILKPMMAHDVKRLMRLMGWVPRNIMEIEDKYSANIRASICNFNMVNNSDKRPGVLRLG